MDFVTLPAGATGCPGICCHITSRVPGSARCDPDPFFGPRAKALFCHDFSGLFGRGAQLGEHRAAVADQGLERTRAIAIAHQPEAERGLPAAAIRGAGAETAARERRLGPVAPPRPTGGGRDARDQFALERARPAAVLGPCDRAPLRRLASIPALTASSRRMGRAVLAGLCAAVSARRRIPKRSCYHLVGIYARMRRRPQDVDGESARAGRLRCFTGLLGTTRARATRRLRTSASRLCRGWTGRSEERPARTVLGRARGWLAPKW